MKRIKLPYIIVAICALLCVVDAKAQHEIWRKERINQGWTYGETRNDELKQPPCLVEYELLPDSEKEYYRNAAIATYNAITKSGFKIYKK